MPYYIASMNIEHEYFDTMKKSLPFQGICFADTFQMFEDAHYLGFAQAENSERVKNQREKPIFVIITNPPYNSNQANENDNNKNRKYLKLEKEINLTYSKESKASNTKNLADPYVKAIKWASKRIGEEGVVAMITNNSFVDNIAFDGMRKHLAKDFTKVYHINLKGNARTSGERRRMEKGNIFNDQIRVSVGISFFIKHDKQQDECEIYYNEIGDYLDSDAKKEYLVKAVDMRGMVWKRLTPDKNNIWLTEGMAQDFEELLPMGDSPQNKSLFSSYSLGINTNRDEWVYSFDKHSLIKNMSKFIDTYNHEIDRWKEALKNQSVTKEKIDDFVNNDESRIKWSSSLKQHLILGRYATKKGLIKNSIYRPFVKNHLYFERILINRPAHFEEIFPTPESENENKVVCLSAVGNTKDFQCLTTNVIPDLHLTGDSQCFPFYTYNEENAPSPQPSPKRGGSGDSPDSGSAFNPPPQGEGATSVAGEGKNYVRRENITDWALEEFRKHYAFPPSPSGRRKEDEGVLKAYKNKAKPPHPDPLLKGEGIDDGSLPKGEGMDGCPPKGREGNDREITKWDIFHYIYALLHHPGYREEYKENLKRSLPRIPFAPDFWAFADAGKQLADLHINYEQAPIHKLEKAEDREAFKDVQFAVKKMRLSQDKTELVYNEAITFKNIPKEVYGYKLGNRSALEWIVDQYQVTTDPRSGITQDPNNFDGNERYIFDLIGKIVTVSLETVKIVNKLAELPYK